MEEAKGTRAEKDDGRFVINSKVVIIQRSKKMVRLFIGFIYTLMRSLVGTCL